MNDETKKEQQIWAVDKAIEITKKAVRGGNKQHPEVILRDLYKELLKIRTEVDDEAS